MTKIKNILAYPLKRLPNMKDYVIGTDAENDGQTVNFPFDAISNIILGDIEYTFSMSSIPLSSPTGNGYFITNGIVDFTLISGLQISKINLAGYNLTPLMQYLGGHVSEFTLRLVNKTNKNIFAYLKINSVIESTDYFTFSVSLAPGNNYLGQLSENDVFTFNYDLNTNASTLPVASETSQGIVQLATAAETITGTNNTKAVHPAGLKAALNFFQQILSLTTTGNSGVATLISNVLNIPRYDLYADSKIENVIVNGVTNKGSSQNAIYQALLLKVDKTQQINTVGPLQGGGNLSGNLSLSILKASASQDGYLSSTDWVIFNNKSNANGTVTEVFALTIGTSGTNINSSVINGTTTPTITLNIPTASATNRGALSPTDWNTFNSKQSTSLLANNILVGNVSNIATGVLMSGDANITTAGVVTNTGLYGRPITMSIGFFKFDGTNWIFDNNTYATSAQLLLKEDKANKQNSLVADGSGIKYSTVDAVNAGLALKEEYSAGAIQGFAVTNNGDGTVNIATGTAFLRATNDPYAPLAKYTIPAVTNLTLTDNANNFVLVDYNGGSPALIVTTNTAIINTETNSIAIVISRVGNVLDYQSLVGQNIDSNAKLRVRFLNQEGIRRANGAIIGFSARNLTLTSGVLFSGLIRINTPAFNTNSPDTFTLVYNNGVVWTRVLSQTQVNNTQYNNAGTLTNLAIGDFRTDYIYLLPNSPSKLYSVMGTTSYPNITQARTATPPSSLPSELQVLGILVGRSIIQRLAANISEVSSAFDTVFPNSPVAEHNALAGIQGGGANDYQHLTTVEKASISKTGLSYACSDETSDLTVGTLITFRMPFGLTLTNVKLSLNAAPTISKLIVDIQKNGVTIFSTLISVDTSQTTSVGASVPAVISDPNLTDDSIITIMTTQIGSGAAGRGLKVTLLGNKT